MAVLSENISTFGVNCMDDSTKELYAFRDSCNLFSEKLSRINKAKKGTV